MIWNLLVSRETDLLERYTRLEGYRDMLGYPQRLRVREFLAARRDDGLTHVYISQKEQARQLREVLKDYQSGACKKYEPVWDNISQSIEIAADTLIAKPTLANWNAFVVWYKRSRATIFYTEMLNEILQQNHDQHGILRYGKIHDDSEKCSSLIWDKARPFFDAIGLQRSVSMLNISFYTLEEFDNLVQSGTLVDEHIIQQRRVYFVILLRDGKIQLIADGKARQFDSNEIPHDEIILTVSKIIGTTVWPGKVQAKVRIVNTKEQMRTMQQGEILVSTMTTVRLMPAIYKAAAIVTDEGGLTCHAAILAREMKKPCIVGTKNATKIFKDGDLVEVDADNGVVRKIK